MSTTTTAPAGEEKEKEKKKHPRDPAREVVETVVFVVVLVLLLKLFVTEAFVIPTGSMAETLYGYQKIIVCPKCGHDFPINSHDEVEGQAPPGGGPKVRQPIVKYICPNCRYHGLISDLNPVPENRTGDRVLVLKPLYHIREPERGDVVVFKYPKAPQENHIAANYIKRAMGFGRETIAIHRGDLYVTTSLEYPPENPIFARPDNPLDLWQPQYMYANSGHAERLFEASRKAGFPAGPIKDLPPELYAHYKPLVDAKEISPDQAGFVPVRKGAAQLLADRRIVWNNDEQPNDLASVVPSRWYAPEAGAANWRGDTPQQARAYGHTGSSLDWIRYRHLAMQWKTAPANNFDPTPRTDPQSLAAQKPTYIENFLGYNASRQTTPAEHLWVGDLILECEVEIPGESEIILELSKGVNRFQAKFGNGRVELSRSGPKGPEFGTRSRPCKVNAGTYKLRFANVDSRLWVWVDGKRIDFGTEGDYSPAEPDKYETEDTQKEGWTQANDIDAPASIGAQGPVTAIRHIKLYRDIYYTWSQGHSGDQTLADIFYIQPGHYLCLGDNSAHSSDSREWGTVPQRLMLGKAVFVFWPAYPPPNRVGFIK